MSFSASFGSQVAAIMDVLAKAAVAEITKLVEDGTVVLRLEMRRKDGEIQELKRSLKLMEVELCKAQEASSRAAEGAREETATGSQVAQKEEEEYQESCALFLEPTAADPLCEPRDAARPSVKPEPPDELVAEVTDGAADAPFEAREQKEPIWPPPACCVFDKASVPLQQHMQIFSPPRGEQYGAHGDASFDSLAEKSSDEPLSAPIKVELEARPLCAADAEHYSPAPLTQDQRLQPALAPPDAPNAEDHVFSRNGQRAKRLVHVWRTNQRLFVCSVCNRGFPRLSQLEEHRAAHQPFKPFRCLECGKSFTQKTRLKTHQSVHTGERPFSCKICGKMFSRQDNCLRHERFHSGVKPYSCGQCGKSFTVLGNLKIHQEIHLQGR